MFGNFREKIQTLQESLAKQTVEVTSGAGMVKVTANGKLEVLSIWIDPELLLRQDTQMLQDLIVAGVNEAIRAAQRMVAEAMGKLTADLGPLGSMLKGL